jgi:hypothetical protein
MHLESLRRVVVSARRMAKEPLVTLILHAGTLHLEECIAIR